MVGLVMPRKRPQDNMPMGIEEPQEDELALCSLTGFSFLMSQAWPRNAGAYDRLLTLRSTTEEELEQWKAALMWFVRKLSFKYGRPVVLKSPAHTGRIRLLLELFPNAKFVHIHRHPYAVLQSARHTVLKVTPWWTFQHPDFSGLDGAAIRSYQEICEAFFEERALIPAGHFHELSFEELEADPIGQLCSAYEALDLPPSSMSNGRCGDTWPRSPTIARTRFPNSLPTLKRKSPRRAGARSTNGATRRKRESHARAVSLQTVRGAFFYRRHSVFSAAAIMGGVET